MIAVVEEVVKAGAHVETVLDKADVWLSAWVTRNSRSLYEL